MRIDAQEQNRGRDTGALVAIDERMVADHGLHQRGAFDEEVGIKITAFEGSLGSGDRGFQQTQVAESVTAADLGDQARMDGKYLLGATGPANGITSTCASLGLMATSGWRRCAARISADISRGIFAKREP